MAALAPLALAVCSMTTIAQTRVTLDFWHSMDGQLGQAVDALVQQFNDSQNEYEVKASYRGSYAEVLSAANRAFEQKRPPHIVQVYEVGTQSMLLSGSVVPLHRLLQQQGVAIDWGDFVETVTGYYAQEGKAYSLPFNSSSPILYYNKEAFRKAGLPDTPPATWKEVEAASRQLLARGAARCGFTASWLSWTLVENTFAWHDQPIATNDNGYGGLDTRLLLNSDFGRMHVGALLAWQKEGIFMHGGLMAQPDAKFASGECAMLLQSSAVIGGFEKSLGFAWGTGALPHWGAPYPKTNSILGGATLWVLRRHPVTHDQGIARFMAFVAAPRRQAWWSASTGYVPNSKAAIRQLQDEAFFTRQPENRTALDQLLNANPTVNSRGLRLGNYEQVRDAIERELESIFAGRKSVKEGLGAAVVRGNAILKEFALTYKPWPGAI